MKLHYPLSFLAINMVLSASCGAAELKASIEIPQFKVAEYHRPYTAIWLEKSDQSFAANLSVWYDSKQENNKGQEWLKDLRQWWRKSGRELQLPIDFLSGASRAPGKHQLIFKSDKAPLNTLTAGKYRLVVESARELGGRELVAIPFQWPITTPQNLKTDGKHELGTVALDLTP
ncbi:MAG: DUF2271 domain-containing protein [Steroidobacteraceae bacterium]